MPRKATGSTHFDPVQGFWYAIITKPDKSRKWVPMKDLTDPNDLVIAKKMAAITSQRWRERGMVDVESPDTLNEYFPRWLESRRERGIVTVSDDNGRFKKWIGPSLGTRAMVEITTRDLETFVSALDAKVRASELAWKTAIHIWGTLSKLFDDAHRAKDLVLRIRKDNPARDVRGPDRGDDRAGPFLFPAELQKLLACDLVPIERRWLYALAVFTGMRAGELRALEWSDVHEDEGFVHVHQAINRETGELKSTKTGVARKVPIEPTLTPLLDLMRERHTSPRIVRMLVRGSVAMFLRSDLKVAKVERAELHDDTPTTRKLDFHDLRHTYGTWRAIRGDDIIKIRFAMGHTDLATTQRYINEAHVFDGGRFGVPFGPLPIESLAKRWDQRLKGRKARETEWVGRDSNANRATPLAATKPAENSSAPPSKPSEAERDNVATPSLETLRAKLDAAIVAEAWDAVKAIRARIVEVEHADVVDLNAERARRTRGS